MSRRLLLINPPVLAVDPIQVSLYAEAIPFGLIQIATHHRAAGDRVDLIDMMGYADRDFGGQLDPAKEWDRKPVGQKGCRGRRAVYLYGRSLDWLDERLQQLPPPDEVFVTCCISFNYEPAHAVVALCRERFPRATLRLGGFYPSLFPEHARGSGADQVHVGRYLPAEAQAPALDVLERVPPVWLFRLVLGCKYRCSFCVNTFYDTEAINDPEAVADEIIDIHERYGVRTFSNWDPNVMLHAEVLERFLHIMAARRAPVQLKFEMGIQPDRLTKAMAEKMRAAGVTAMTIPFESVEPAMMRRFRKPYRTEHSIEAVSICRDLGFDTHQFHCTSVLGIRGESYEHIFGTWATILASGGRPTPFPLSPTPGTQEYDRHRPMLTGKDLSELNGHLWPTLESIEQVERYDLMFQIVSQRDPQRALAMGRHLPAEAREALERALEVKGKR